jgi:cytochrome c-type biogenesis protein CcmH/NrfG
MTDVTDHAALEEERDFLLRSLDDLDAERADGNVDDETYARLHADYTARAARILHRLEGASVEAEPAPLPVSARRRVLTGLAIVAFAVVAGVALAYGLGARLPGQTITGNGASRAASQNREQLQQLRADVKARPSDPAAHLALARALLSDDPEGALTEFRAAATLDPTNPEPYAYSGWLVRLSGYPDEGLTLIDKAISLDAAYPDARFFKGVILLRDKSDPSGATTEFQQYLVAAPDSPLATQVRQLLAQAVEAGSGPTSTTTTKPPSRP